MIKRIILFSTLSFSSFVFSQRHGCSLEDTVFFSYTLDHVNAVEICKQNNVYKITYGKITSPDFVLMKPNLKINKFYFGPGTGIRITDGENIYEVTGGKFIDSILKFNIDNNGLYQVLDSRDENFINNIN